MNDNIDIQTIWFDNNLTELQLICSSEIITASAKIYVTDELIDDLIDKINQLLSGNVAEIYWANEEKGDDSSACVELHFLSKDNLGHILIEVYMEIDDGGFYSKHNCCFFIKTEIGLLEEFCKNLHLLKQKSLKTRIILNDSDYM